jgi:hypothetical protein
MASELNRRFPIDRALHNAYSYRLYLGGKRAFHQLDHNGAFARGKSLKGTQE